MCRVHPARPCTPPQGVDTPQLRRPLRGVCEAIVVRTHHDDRATATPSEAATGARWFPPKRKGGATKAAVAPRTALMARLQCCAGRDGAFVPRSHCGHAPPAPPPLRRMEWRQWRWLRCGVVPGGAAKPSDRQTPQRGRFAPVAKECACRNRITKRAAPTALPLLRRWWQWRRGGGVVVAVAATAIGGYAYRGAWTLCERVTVGGERDPLHVRPTAESVPATPISNIGVAGTLFARVTVGGERDPLHVRPAAEG